MSGSSPEERIDYLEGRVEALEQALEERSRELRVLQHHLSRDGLLMLARVRHGLPPLPREAYELRLWHETTELTSADVETTMVDLWRSLSTPDAELDDG